MSKSKLGISSFDLDIKFKDKDEAYRYAKRLKEFIRYTCNKYENYEAQAIICTSNIKGNTSIVYYEHNGKKGRPKKIKEYSPFDIKYYNGNLEVDWHIHILLVSKPVYAFREKIKAYIDKNWYDKLIKKEYVKSKEYKRTYKKDTNIKKIEYFIDQAEDILFCNYCNEDTIPKEYSLKKLYNAFMKMRTAKRNIGKISNKKLLKADDDYYKIMKYYWNITKEQNNKSINDFMGKIKQEKIIDNIDILKKGNKVQKNLCRRNGIFKEDIGF